MAQMNVACWATSVVCCFQIRDINQGFVQFLIAFFPVLENLLVIEAVNMNLMDGQFSA